MRVLMVEDDPAISGPLRATLEREGYQVYVCDDGKTALDAARTWDPDVVLLDVQLPDMNGRDIARGIRSFSSVPIIMVTARGEVEDRVSGLDAGATDYLVKPFAPPELLARIRAATRRAPAIATSSLNFQDLMLDLSRLKAFKSGVDLELSSKEFELLRLLIVRPGTVIRRDELTRAIWGVGTTEGSNTLDVHMSWLRKKLGDDSKDPRHIETVRGVGFRLCTA